MADFSQVHPFEFAVKVKEMRKAQRNYFRVRTSVYLNKAKQLEEEVDEMLIKIHGPEQKPPPPPTQNTLFGA